MSTKRLDPSVPGPIASQIEGIKRIRKMRDKLAMIENIAINNDGDRLPGSPWAAVLRLCREALDGR